MTEEPCFGCGLRLPVHDGATHAYIGASAACWAVYGEVLAREYGAYRNPPCHRLTVDAYAVQHPGSPSRRAQRSVCGHLVALHAALELELDSDNVTALLGRFLEYLPEPPWLQPPATLGTVTVADVAATRWLEEHAAAVQTWARDVWAAWDAHHGVVREWTTAVMRAS